MRDRLDVQQSTMLLSSYTRKLPLNLIGKQLSRVSEAIIVIIIMGIVK